MPARMVVQGIVLAIVAGIPFVHAQDIFDRAGVDSAKGGQRLGTVIAANGIAVEVTENAEGSLDRISPETVSGRPPSTTRSRFLVRTLKTGETLYLVNIMHGVVQEAARPFNRAIPRDKSGGYTHGEAIQLVRYDLYEGCRSGKSCGAIEVLFAVFTPDALSLYEADDGLVLKMIADDGSFDIVRVPKDHMDAARAVAAQQ